jgi:lycopene cyclase domain-containing protein
MSYLEFLIVFLLPPIGILITLTFYDQRRKQGIPAEFHAQQPWKVILLLIVVAVFYTTPWDNYLVATSVWWYDLKFVTGYVIGWVPIEEYAFFILQTALTELFTFTLVRYLPLPDKQFLPIPSLRWLLTLGLIPIWILSLLALQAGWDAGTYLAILLAWAIPPIALQLAFGADILWHYRQVVLLAITIPTIYLAFADSLAISAGVWTINPGKSFMLFIGSLPIEEFIFFLTTNTLVVLGTTLVSTETGQTRLMNIMDQVRMKRNRHQAPSSNQQGVVND